MYLHSDLERKDYIFVTCFDLRSAERAIEIFRLQLYNEFQWSQLWISSTYQYISTEHRAKIGQACICSASSICANRVEFGTFHRWGIYLPWQQPSMVVEETRRMRSSNLPSSSKISTEIVDLWRNFKTLEITNNSSWRINRCRFLCWWLHRWFRAHPRDECGKWPV